MILKSHPIFNKFATKNSIMFTKFGPPPKKKFKNHIGPLTPNLKFKNLSLRPQILVLFSQLYEFGYHFYYNLTRITNLRVVLTENVILSKRGWEI